MKTKTIKTIFSILCLVLICGMVNAQEIEVEKGDSLDLAMQDPRLKVIPDYVFELTNLTFLDVSFNRINTVPKDILKLTKLETLYLSGNQSMANIPDFLMEMESLKTIYLEGMTAWSKEKKQGIIDRFKAKGITVIVD